MLLGAVRIDVLMENFDSLTDLWSLIYLDFSKVFHGIDTMQFAFNESLFSENIKATRSEVNCE